MQGTAAAEKTGSTAGRGGGRMQSDLLSNPSPVFISAGSRRVSSTIFFFFFSSPANFCPDGFLHFKKNSKLITNIK